MSVIVPVMGTGATLRTPTGPPSADVVERIRSHWERLEQTFSLFRPGSELSRIARGEVALSSSGEEVRSAYAEALRWRELTDGDFTPHRPDGALDLSGTVKARAIQDAGRMLDEVGLASWLVEIGGDVLTRAPDRQTWSAGIADPHDVTRLLTGVDLGGRWRAIATSGTAERGEHVWRSRQHGRLVQVTVLGVDIMEVDVLATAILAGGLPALDAAGRRFDVDVLTVDAEGDLRVTPRLRRAITAPA
ncbi:FAD:protein FMN transferase [Microbacterium oryzae]|uniref:FAD:protein FMN transferase n=1 Tax=Microbacterium oryzae TaxID=743009 RepID=UPI0025B23C48|nr:FAD:protein FMN transferase [Microbacterium oryzae]MDN3310622.1 FAD:protein FMN transferase [Microbacterium oryzae]